MPTPLFVSYFTLAIAFVLSTGAPLSFLQTRKEAKDGNQQVNGFETTASFAYHRWYQANVVKAASFSEDGYQRVADLKDDVSMTNYVRRFLESKGMEIRSEKELEGFIPWYSGTIATQTFEKMWTELQAKAWISSKWVGGKELVEKYGDENAIYMVEHDSVSMRDNPDAPDRIQFAKNWIGETALRQNFTNESIDELSDQGFIETRLSPNDPNRTEFFVTANPLALIKTSGTVVSKAAEIEADNDKSVDPNLASDDQMPLSLSERAQSEMPAAHTQATAMSQKGDSWNHKEWISGRKQVEKDGEKRPETMIVHNVSAMKIIRQYREKRINEEKLHQHFTNETVDKRSEQGVLGTRKNLDTPKHVQFLTQSSARIPLSAPKNIKNLVFTRHNFASTKQSPGIHSWAKSWMSETMLNQSYDKITIEKLNESGRIETRTNPDTSKRTQFFVKNATSLTPHSGKDGKILWPKAAWMSSKVFFETYGEVPGKNMMRLNFIATRQNPDFPERTQYAKNWTSEKHLHEIFDNATIAQMDKAGLIETRRNPNKGSGGIQYFVKLVVSNESATNTIPAQNKTTSRRRKHTSGIQAKNVLFMPKVNAEGATILKPENNNTWRVVDAAGLRRGIAYRYSKRWTDRAPWGAQYDSVVRGIEDGEWVQIVGNSSDSENVLVQARKKQVQRKKKVQREKQMKRKSRLVSKDKASANQPRLLRRT